MCFLGLYFQQIAFVYGTDVGDYNIRTFGILSEGISIACIRAVKIFLSTDSPFNSNADANVCFR